MVGYIRSYQRTYEQKGKLLVKAIIFHAYGDVEVLQIADIPKPKISEGEVLVKVTSAAINPKDTFIRTGRFKRFTGNQFPQQTGFDFAGIVAETTVADFAVGEAVFGMLDGWHGKTCAEYVAVSSNQLVYKPANVSFDSAAGIALVGLTALQALRNEGKINSGDRVCINGASGGVGAVAVQIAKIYGCHVTAIASKKHHDLLYELGANKCIDYHETAITKSDLQFDVFFDVFGNTRFRDIKAILTVYGKWISTAIKPHVFISSILSRFSTKTAKLIVVESTRKDLLTIADWMAQGQLQAVIAGTYALNDIQSAHQLQQSKHAGGKILIQVDI